MNRILKVMLIVGIAAVVLCCGVFPVTQNWPYYNGRPLIRGWAGDLGSPHEATRVEARRVLRIALKDNDPTVRKFACMGIAYYATPNRKEAIVPLVPDLVERVRDQDHNVRLSAVTILSLL